MRRMLCFWLLSPLFLLDAILASSRHHSSSSSSEAGSHGGRGHGFVLDLSHAYESSRMPITEGGTPLEVMKETRDDGHCLLYTSPSPRD